MNTYVLEQLKRIRGEVDALIQTLEAQGDGHTVQVGELRRVAVLEEVYRQGGSATPEEISAFARKYGKAPSSTAGYYSGHQPSMETNEDRSLRRLTAVGEQTVLEARENWGEDWLDRLPMNIVGSKHITDAEVSF